MEIPNEFYHEETRNDFHIPSETKKLWGVLLTLGLELKRICEKYNIRYFLHAGSLLGAVRHTGFIPWDDDMDFVILREDFGKFLEAAEYEIKYPFYLQTPENSDDIFNNGRYLLRMQDTTGVQFIHNLHCSANQGIAIDILILDNVTENFFIRKRQWYMMDFYAGIMFLKKYGNRYKRLKTLGWGYFKTGLFYHLSKIISDKFLIKKIVELPQKYSNKQTEIYISFQEILGSYRHNMVPAEAYRKGEMMKFEGFYFPVPSGYDVVLKTYYGEDYMQFPPLDERKGHHYPVLSLTENYTTVLKRFQDVFNNVDGKKIIIFGAGQMLEHYLKHTSSKYHPQMLSDNDRKKWGTSIHNIPVVSPSEISNINPQERHIIICSIYYKEISAQLISMGINDFYIYVQNEEWI